MSLPELLERDEELARCTDAVAAAAAGRGCLLVVEGEAGIGKTALLRVVVELARAHGLDVLRARGGELERDVAYGIARQLFEGRLLGTSAPRRRTLLSGAAAAAAPALGLAPGELVLAPEDASFAMRHGLYWLVANLSAQMPLLLCVDDLHWADGPSLRWIAYLAHRIDELPVAILVAVRSGDPAAEAPLVRAVRLERTGAPVTPRPLTIAAARRLVGAGLDEVAEACHRASGGNPFMLEQLAQALAEQGHVVRAEDVEHMSPASVAEQVRQRLERLPTAAAALAEAVAVLGDDAEPRHARAISKLSSDEAAGASDALVEARVLADGVPLAFIHPLVRASVYAGIAPARRSAMHRRAAAVLLDVDARSDHAAMHLLAADPDGDAETVHRLCEAAERALARGAPGSALALYERALAEPPTAAVRARVLLGAGHASRDFDAMAAVQRLRAALAAADDLETRAQAATALAGVLVGQDEAVDVLESALAELPGAERGLRLSLEADLAMIAQFSHEHSERIGRRLERRSEELTGETPAERVLLAALALDRLLRCAAPAAHVGALAERALAGEGLVPGTPPHGVAVETLLHAERFDAARDALDRGLADARARASRLGQLAIHIFRARLSLFTGDLRAAEADGSHALSDAEVFAPHVAAWGASCLARVLIARGETAAASELLAEHHFGEGAPPPTTFGTDILLARCELHLAAGRAAEAAADGLDVLRRRGLSGGTMPPAGWRTATALALHAAGRREEAAGLAEQEVAVAEYWGAPGALGSALRIQGVLLGGDDGLRTLERAVTVLEHSDRRLELARALVDQGAALRRQRHRSASRDPLRRALDLAHRCGAGGLAERAHEELLAGGARPRRPSISGRDALTPSERRVAALAAEGLDNPRIAQALYVSRKTVETHLRSVYRKLDIKSRDDLGAVL